MRPKAAQTRKFDRTEAEFGGRLVILDVNMREFQPFQAEKRTDTHEAA
jgi:hypothetical protein